MPQTALLAGATGLVGSALLPRLLAADRYDRVVVVGRRPVALDHPKLSQVVTDLSQLTAVAPRLRADDVFCCLGTTIKQAGSQAAFRQVDYGFVVELARLTAGQGAVQLLVVSSLGAAANSRVFYSRVKGEMEAAVAKLPFQACHVFRPSLLLGPRAQPRLGERLASAAAGLLSPLLRGPLRNYRPVPAATVAEAMLRAASQQQHGLHFHESATLQG